MKEKKVIKGTAGMISNSQSINPSVNFSFSHASSGIKGFAIKRKSVSKTQNKPDTKEASKFVRSKSTNKHSTEVVDTVHNESIDSEINTPEIAQKTSNIKRKRKKDKQKALAIAGDSDTIQQAISHVKTTPKEYSLFNVKPKIVHIQSRTGKSISEKVFNKSGNKFSDLQIHKHLVSNLEKIHFNTLTTVQEKAIPIILEGKDSLIRSQTGSGKTLAYAVPIMDALQGIVPRIQRKDGVQAMIVVPTRELALQTHELFNKINTFQWIVTGHLCGGENRKTEKDRLRKGVHILIGTPGRLLDHVLHTSAVKLENIRCLVLDEADRLLDMGFRKDIIRLLEELDKAKSNLSYNPLELLKSSHKTDNNKELDVDSENIEFPLRDITSKRRQTILLSATLTDGVSELANFTMDNHVFIDALDEASNTSINSLIIPDTVKQEFVLTYVKHRLFTLSALLISKSRRKSKIFVFMASTQMVEFHYELFTQCLLKMPVNRGKPKVGGIVVFDEDDNKSDSECDEEVVLNTQFFKLHGNMDQLKRKEVFTAFREAKLGVLLCTDVAARGLDVPEADCIIQYTGPQTNEDYLHRVGRTGRAGKVGSAIIFLTHEEQDYISCLNEQRVYLKQLNTDELLKCLCDTMHEPDKERAAEALQRHYENSVLKSKSLHLTACFAYSSWSRFYNTYPRKLREVFDFKKINLGHYATSFALRETPSAIARIVKGQVGNKEPQRLNKKLANFPENANIEPSHQLKNKRSIALVTSEYSSGLEPVRKKKKKSE